MRRNRKAKIIATLGPSTSNFKSIKKLFDQGADVFRLNFSHDTKESHVKRFKDIRNLEKKVNNQKVSLRMLKHLILKSNATISEHMLKCVIWSSI